MSTTRTRINMKTTLQNIIPKEKTKAINHENGTKNRVKPIKTNKKRIAK